MDSDIPNVDSAHGNKSSIKVDLKRDNAILNKKDSNEKHGKNKDSTKQMDRIDTKEKDLSNVEKDILKSKSNIEKDALKSKSKLYKSDQGDKNIRSDLQSNEIERKHKKHKKKSKDVDKIRESDGGKRKRNKIEISSQHREKNIPQKLSVKNFIMKEGGDDTALKKHLSDATETTRDIKLKEHDVNTENKAVKRGKEETLKEKGASVDCPSKSKHDHISPSKIKKSPVMPRKRNSLLRLKGFLDDSDDESDNKTDVKQPNSQILPGNLDTFNSSDEAITSPGKKLNKVKHTKVNLLDDHIKLKECTINLVAHNDKEPVAKDKSIERHGKEKTFAKHVNDEGKHTATMEDSKVKTTGLSYQIFSKDHKLKEHGGKHTGKVGKPPSFEKKHKHTSSNEKISLDKEKSLTEQEGTNVEKKHKRTSSSEINLLEKEFVEEKHKRTSLNERILIEKEYVEKKHKRTSSNERNLIEKEYVEKKHKHVLSSESKNLLGKEKVFIEGFNSDRKHSNNLSSDRLLIDKDQLITEKDGSSFEKKQKHISTSHNLSEGKSRVLVEKELSSLEKKQSSLSDKIPIDKESTLYEKNQKLSKSLSVDNAFIVKGKEVSVEKKHKHSSKEKLHITPIKEKGFEKCINRHPQMRLIRFLLLLEIWIIKRIQKTLS